MADFDEMVAQIPNDGVYHTHTTQITPNGEWNLLIYTLPDGTERGVLFKGSDVVWREE